MDTPAYLKPGMKEWLLYLPILYRLYTSVIVLDPEILAHKESWSTDLSPTALFAQRHCTRGSTDVMGTTGMVGRGVPGVGRSGRVREGYTGYYPAAIPGPIFNIYLKTGPTHGRMNLKSEK